MARPVRAFKVCRFDELAPGEARGVNLDGVEVAVARIGDSVYAIGDVCTHQRISLADGEVHTETCELECWKHGSRFSLLDGHPSELPAVKPVKVFDVSVEDGAVIVHLP